MVFGTQSIHGYTGRLYYYKMRADYSIKNERWSIDKKINVIGENSMTYLVKKRSKLNGNILTRTA